MIWIYTGTPGSGKSLDVARDICQKMRQGKTVICNFPVEVKNIKKAKGNFIYKNDDEMTVDYLTKYAIKNHRQGKEGQTLVVIDEAQIKFNCRDFGRKDRNAWVKFFCLHRHLGYNIILVAQNDRMIDKQIRALIEYEVKHKKLNKNGFGGWLLSFTCLTWFYAIEYWYGGKMILSKRMFAYRKKYSKIYDSYKMFGDLVEENGLEGLLSVPGGTAGGGAPGEGGSTSRPLLSVELEKKDSTDSRDCENCKFNDDCSDIERENCNSDYFEPLEMCSSV